MKELSSHVCGRFVAGKERAATLVNPATEEALASASTEGIDFGEVLAFARDRGGPALRAMTFKQRGELLRAMSKSIHAKRDELLGLAVANGGNTRSDAKFDVDGAIGTLAAYADLAPELGEGHVLVDGEATQLGRSPRLFGQHLYVPREGVAVHVNAFNFPAWGLGEKAACALLAGMPVIAKPATSTALLAHRIVEILIEDRVLPEGALSFVCGSSGDLLDRLGGQDVLAFTGSSGTAGMLRGGKAFALASAHVNVEADSLNAAVLGADVADGSELMNLFVGDVVRDMTQKTGQKCTAIRRVYVPAALVEAVVERMRERLAAVKVGDPSREDVGMGPVATAQQLRDVREGITRLAAGAQTACGGAEPVEALGVPKGKGFFVAPTLFVAGEARRDDAAHTHEVFGPVATVIPYDGSSKAAVTFVSWGGGGLVSSAYTDDKDFVKDFALGIAPFHGRVTIGTSKTASQSMPPGLVLPQLLHGGPGRAGGGEELGGRRGLALYMQRVAIQGDRALVEAVAGKR
jgi:3,4-dehydroadipyl-CoA semialdehyde dehydrogenase